MSEKMNNSNPIKVNSTSTPKFRHGGLNEFGWGLKGKSIKIIDGKYELDEPNLANPKPLGDFKKNCKIFSSVDLYIMEKKEKVVQKPEDYPPPQINENFANCLKEANIEFTDDFHERLYRSLSQTFLSLYQANYSKVDKLVDLVVFPGCHDHVVKIVEYANHNNVILIPIGGSTNVTESTCHPNNAKDQRSVVVVDCTQMNRLMWIDEENMLACFESGIAGRDLEIVLKERGYTCGHEPDSIDFSTLGGWISTRASGMKRQKYGNIEECIKNFKFVTSVGVLMKQEYPRVSMGPSIRDLIFGSEGTLGIISEATIKIYRLPEVVKYGSIVFPNFESGVKFMNDMSRTSLVPASLRLVDNFHYRVSQVVREHQGMIQEIIEPIKRGYLWYIKGFDQNKIAVATFKMEGDRKNVDVQDKTVREHAQKYSGIFAGEYHGRKAYDVTFHIGYIRDYFGSYGVLADSTETSVNWSKVNQVIKAVEALWKKEMSFEKNPDLLCNDMGYRISQIYSDGVCLYFYYSFGYHDQKNTFNDFLKMRTLIMKTIVDAGGSISHHHGIGKKCREKYVNTLSPLEFRVFEATKRELDPKNIFANGNLYLNLIEQNSDDRSRKIMSKL